MTEGHIVKRYDGELNHLHYLVLEMGVLVARQVSDALTAFHRRDLNLAHQVVARDNAVSHLEVSADDESIKLLARRCPVANDLRTVIAVSKSVSDLERIGDEAVKIAHVVIQVFGHEGGQNNHRLGQVVHTMGDLATRSLQSAVEVFDAWDEEKARRVIASHREMDEEFQSGLRRLLTFIMEDCRNIGFAISVVLVIKSLERIGHHAQSVAKYAFFQVKGEDVRARPRETSNP